MVIPNRRQRSFLIIAIAPKALSIDIGATRQAVKG
jgi:hypothetical protein